MVLWSGRALLGFRTIRDWPMHPYGLPSSLVHMLLTCACARPLRCVLVQGVRKRPAPEAAAAGEDAEDDMAAAMLPRKARNLYASVRRREGAKKARVAELGRRAAALAQQPGDEA